MDYNKKYDLRPNEELVKLNGIGEFIKNTINDLIFKYLN